MLAQLVTASTGVNGLSGQLVKNKICFFTPKQWIEFLFDITTT